MSGLRSYCSPAQCRHRSRPGSADLATVRYFLAATCAIDAEAWLANDAPQLGSEEDRLRLQQHCCGQTGIALAGRYARNCRQDTHATGLLVDGKAFTVRCRAVGFGRTRTARSVCVSTNTAGNLPKSTTRRVRRPSQQPVASDMPWAKHPSLSTKTGRRLSLRARDIDAQEFAVQAHGGPPPPHVDMLAFNAWLEDL